ncbi:MAG: DNA primase catalytic subunit PriS [Promethearchaeota archaeon]
MREKKLLDYYRNRFSLDPFLSVIDNSDFEKREFAFVLLNGRFIRNHSFASPSSLLYFIQSRPLLHIYVGAVYNQPVSTKNPITKNRWKKRELVFDLDLTDFDVGRKRSCGCQGGNAICYQCWEMIKAGVYFIDESLRQDFGFQHIKWVFSGRRGVHAWILDKQAAVLTTQQRLTICNWVSLVKHKSEGLPKETLSQLPWTFSQRIVNLVIKPFLMNVTDDDLLELGIPPEYTTRFLALIRNQHISYQEIIKLLTASIKGEIETQNKILKWWFPRIDNKVTIDTHRVLRMPGSIHGITGKPATILDESQIESFDPFSIHSIY